MTDMKELRVELEDHTLKALREIAEAGGWTDAETLDVMIITYWSNVKTRALELREAEKAA